MEDVIKIEAKDFVMSGIEKASGQFGINIEVIHFERFKASFQLTFSNFLQESEWNL